MAKNFFVYGKRELLSPKGNGNAEEYFLKVGGLELAVSTNPFLREVSENSQEA